MKYEFRVIRYADPLDGELKCAPLPNIENSQQYGHFFVDEINNLSIDYLYEILGKLEALIKGEIEYYGGFGYEIYMIECWQDIAIVKNIYENDKVEAIIPTIEVYSLIKDWLVFLSDFNHK